MITAENEAAVALGRAKDERDLVQIALMQLGLIYVELCQRLDNVDSDFCKSLESEIRDKMKELEGLAILVDQREKELSAATAAAKPCRDAIAMLEASLVVASKNCWVACSNLSTCLQSKGKSCGTCTGCPSTNE